MPEVAVIPLWTTRPSTRMADAQGPPAQRPLVADAYLARPDRIAKPNKTRAHSGHPHRLGMLPVVQPWKATTAAVCQALGLCFFRAQNEPCPRSIYPPPMVLPASPAGRYFSRTTLQNGSEMVQ
jgi:hypothetical protein